MPNKIIEEILNSIKNKYGLSGLHSKPTGYMDYEDKTDEVFKDIEVALQKAIQEERGIIAEKIMDKIDELKAYSKEIWKDYETVNEVHFAIAQLKEVLNAINKEE